MSTKGTVVVLVFAWGIWAVPPVTRSAEPKAADTAKAKLRVGVFDSRTVAVAYVGSKPFDQRLQKMMEEKKQAEATGDRQKVERLDADGRALQEQTHLQVFGGASVADILDTIRDQIPALAQEAGVDLVVSKWDIAYQAPGAQLVDVTRLMIRPFHPDQRTLRTVKEMEKDMPISLEELKKHKDY